MSRAVKLTDDERRGIMLPGDPHYDYFASLCTKVVARAPYVTVRPVEPRRDAAMFVDAFAGGSAALTLVPIDETDDAPPPDVLVGCAVSARLLHVAVMALPDAQAAITWGGRFEPLALTVGDATAYVMPRRCCSHGQERGVHWVRGERRECRCRDCAAGRRWGW